MANAVGILEVYGLTTAFVAADAACKAADVFLENFDIILEFRKYRK